MVSMAKGSSLQDLINICSSDDVFGVNVAGLKTHAGYRVVKPHSRRVDESVFVHEGMPTFIAVRKDKA